MVGVSTSLIDRMRRSATHTLPRKRRAAVMRDASRGMQNQPTPKMLEAQNLWVDQIKAPAMRQHPGVRPNFLGVRYE